MQIYHTTRARAEKELSNAGYTYERGERMGDGVYRNEKGNRTWIDEARYRSYDSKGKYWFMLQVRVS